MIAAAVGKEASPVDDAALEIDQHRLAAELREVLGGQAATGGAAGSACRHSALRVTPWTGQETKIIYAGISALVNGGLCDERPRAISPSVAVWAPCSVPTEGKMMPACADPREQG